MLLIVSFRSTQEELNDFCFVLFLFYAWFGSGVGSRGIGEMVGYHQSAQAQHFQHELDDDDEEFYHRHQQHQQQQQQRLQQRYIILLEIYIYIFKIAYQNLFEWNRIKSRILPQRSREHYNRLQYRRMYRYGLSLLLVGALCNWLGFAQHYFAPVRYLVSHFY